MRRRSVPAKIVRYFRKNLKMFYRLAGVLGLAAFLHGLLNLPWYTYPVNALTFGFCFYLATGGWKFVRAVYLTIGRDLGGVGILIHVKRQMKGHFRKQSTVADIFHDTVLKHPNKLAMVSVDTGTRLTFTEAEALANQVGNIFYGLGLQKGDVVALYMESSPEYICLWLGLSKIGVITALINFNLRQESLTHCINISKPKAIIYSPTLADAVKEVYDKLDGSPPMYCFGEDSTIPGNVNLQGMLLQSPATSPPQPKDRAFLDKLIFIYTSGTTGLPKAAIIRNSRFYFMSYGISSVYNVTHDDVNYIPLPLYHSNGGILGVGTCLFKGATIVIRKKFSASRFFDDCINNGATMTHYIGETCRYLLAQPKKDTDRAHKLRLATGNGLRPQIWEEFVSRFEIKQIGEFYGSTEGNANVVNTNNRVGSVGFNSILAPWIFPLQLIRVDQDTGELMRGADGLAIPCKYGEPGEMVGKIIKDDPLRHFDGYLNQQATSKKLVYNIFKHGDAAFLSGDILVQDELGYFYFHDRTGDTFRWRGENVSTSEVESVVSKILHLRDVAVYGVEIKNVEGKAGMAAIVDPDGHVDLEELAHSLAKALAPYAKPVFLRITDSLDTTGTFKLQKVRLRKEGFDPKLVGNDKLYYMNNKSGKYERLDKTAYDKILSGAVRF